MDTGKRNLFCRSTGCEIRDCFIHARSRRTRPERKSDHFLLWEGKIRIYGTGIFQGIASRRSGSLPPDRQYYCIEPYQRVLKLHMNQRREIAFITAIIIGLLVGRFMKKVTIGLIIGLVLGYWQPR